MGDRIAGLRRRWPSFAVVALLVIAALGWWGFGTLPPGAVQAVPANHWLACYARSDGTIDADRAFRDQRGAAGSPQENLVALLIGVLGPAALSPVPSPALRAALGMITPSSGHPQLELPPAGKAIAPQEMRKMLDDVMASHLKQPAGQPTLSARVDAAAKKPWHDAEFPVVAAWLDRQQVVLDSVRQWQPRRCRIPWTPEQTADKPTRLNHSSVNFLAHACAAAAFRALGRNDCRTAVRYAAVLYRMGASSSGDDDIDDLIQGSRVAGLAAKVMEVALTLPTLTQADLAPWLAAAATSPWAPDVGRAIDRGDRLFMITSLQNGPLRVIGKADFAAVLGHINFIFDQSVAAASIPSWKDQQRQWRRLDETILDLEHHAVWVDYAGIWGRMKLTIGGPYLRRDVARKLVAERLLTIITPQGESLCAIPIYVAANLSLISAAIILRQDQDADNLPSDPFGSGPVHHDMTASGVHLWIPGRNDQGAGNWYADRRIELNMPLPY